MLLFAIKKVEMNFQNFKERKMFIFWAIEEDFLTNKGLVRAFLFLRQLEKGFWNNANRPLDCSNEKK